MNNQPNIETMADIYEMMDATVKVGKDLAFEIPLKKYGTWHLIFKRVE